MAARDERERDAAERAKADSGPGDRSWAKSFAIYFRPRVIGMTFLGFSAGLPFLLVFSTLSFWLAESGLEPSTITFFSWIGLAYSIKVFWAPVLDHVRLPLLGARLGRRRSWMLVGMTGIAVGLVALAHIDPRESLGLVAAFALLVAFSSATQDVAIDAYRIEAVERDLQGAMAATYQLGYRIALLAAGAGALALAEIYDWRTAYLTMAGLSLVGIATTLTIREPESSAAAPSYRAEPSVRAFLVRSEGMGERPRAIAAWFLGAVVAPLADFLRRYGMLAVAILLFVGVFRISDVMMGSIASKFYFDLGFTKIEVATVVKGFGLFATILGAFLGGFAIARFGLMRPLVLAAVMIASTNLCFAVLALFGHDIAMLYAAIGADNLTGGYAGSVFIAYLSSLTSTTYTATQYALFSSLMTLPGKFLGGWSGTIAEGLGLAVDPATGAVLNPAAYANFFAFVAAAGIPSIALALYLARRAGRAARKAQAAPA
jgi:PAT family beta-lactamase induction signal transducer AmpG